MRERGVDRRRRERIGIQAGDLFRSPDRPTARWHRVVKVGLRKDGTRYITIHRARIWRAFGLSPMQRLEFAEIKALGFGVRKQHKPRTGPVGVAHPVADHA